MSYLDNLDDLLASARRDIESIRREAQWHHSEHILPHYERSLQSHLEQAGHILRAYLVTRVRP